jgi:uncharacterized membrane protein YfcA
MQSTIGPVAAPAASRTRGVRKNAHRRSGRHWPVSKPSPEKTEEVAPPVACVSSSAPSSSHLLPWLCLSLSLVFALGPGSSTIAQMTMAVVFACATIAGIAGFAYSALAGALLLHLHADPVSTIELLLVTSIAMQAFAVWSIRRTIRIRMLAAYLAGSLVTAPIGIYLLLSLHADVFAPVLGVLLILYSGYALAQPSLSVGYDNPGIRVVIGGLGGLTGAMAAFPAAFIAPWCRALGLDKQRQRAIVQPYILIMQVWTLVILWSAAPHRSFNFEHLQFVPPAIFGAYVGLSLYERLSTSQFNRVVALLLLASGLILASSGV